MNRRRVPEPSAAVRELAVVRVLEGEPAADVAEWVGVTERSVWNWVAAWRASGGASGGAAGLGSRPRSGRPPKLSDAQAERVLGWVDGSPLDFGFATDRWTAPRVAALVEGRLGVSMNHRYLNDWLRRRGVTPQVPEDRPRERDEAVVRGWLRHQWPRIKKR